MEREADHVRMMDAGRLQLPYAPLTTSDGFASVASDKFAALAHGNQYGLTFVPTPTGFAMATQAQYDDGRREFIARKLSAIDHGQNASHVDIPVLAIQKEVELPTIAYQLSLSPDELHLAVAYKDSLVLFEVATIIQSEAPLPYHTFHNVVVNEICWSPETNENGGEPKFAVLTHAKTVLSCSTDGSQRTVSKAGAVSLAWSPAGESIAVGMDDGSVHIFNVDTFARERSIDRPECCVEGYEAHHVNWAEEDVFLVGYRQYDADREESSALACLFEGGECVELDELVAFADFEGRKHQYYSVFLADWRMFFIGCSLSADIELLVADPESGEWEVWKASEKYQARLPMNSNDDEMYPLGLSLNLNAHEDIEVDDAKYPPPAVVSCATTDGLLINFSFVDMTVREVLPFVQRAKPFSSSPTRATESTGNVPAAEPSVETESAPVASGGKASYRVTTSDVDNVPASEDSDDSDLEEEMEEERQNAIEAFDEIDAASSGVIDKSRFADLLVMLGTTYGEESHGKYAKRLADSSGVIGKEEFVNWYVDWIFGEQDSDDDEDVEEEEGKPSTASSAVNALAKFAVAEGSWRCEVCMVRNQDADAPKCISCESPNPNFKGKTTTALGTQPSAQGSKFSFGISPGEPTQSTTTSSFSFGLGSGSSVTQAPTSGFSFGFTPPSSGASAPMASSGGFKFGVTADASTPSIAPALASPSVNANPGGFQFKTATSTEPEKKKPADEGTETKTTTSSGKQDQGYGKNDENEFAHSDGEESDEEEERKEEEESARKAFAKISSGDESIPRDKFPALFKALGSTYSEEEHSETCDSLDNNGRIYVDDFIKWYLDWLFGEDEDSDDDDDANDDSGEPQQKMKSVEEIAAVFAKFQPKEGSWKCEVCLSVNPTADAQKCSACESPNPTAPKQKAAAPPAPSLGSSGASNFKFGVSSEVKPEDKPSNFTFGFTPPSATTSATASGDAKSETKSSGFSFGFTPAAGTNSAASVSSAFGGTSSKSSISFGAQPNSTTPSFGSGFSFGTRNSVTTSQATPPPTSASAYPPDTSKKVAPPPAPGAYPPDTSKKVAPPPAPGAYPPDTSKKVAPPPAPGAYPPDTSKKVAPPPAPGAYPPDTSKKVAPPPAPGAYPPDTSKKVAPPPAPGAYPPDTSKKVAPPPAPGAYPPDTSKKAPPPPAPGAYPPSTSTKPAPPPFTLATPASSTATTSAPSSFSFGGMSSSLFGSTKASESGSEAPKPSSVFSFATSAPDASSKTTPSPFGVVPKSNTGFSFGGSQAPASTTSSAGSATTASSSAFSFGTPAKSTVVPEASKTASAFGAPAASSTPFSFSSVPQQTKPVSSVASKPPGFASAPPAKPALAAPTAPTASKPSFAPQRPNLAVNELDDRRGGKEGSTSLPGEKPFQSGDKLVRATASSQLEAQLWKLIIDFDRAFRRVNHSTQNVCSADKAFHTKFAQQVSDLQKKVSSLCDEVNTLDDVRDQVEKDVLFVIGSDGDVHEQLEYGREILASFKNEKLKRLLEEQPLDQRSEDTRKSVQDKLAAVEQACDDLDRHIASTKNYTSAGAFAGNLNTSSAAMSSGHLFRALKQTYDSSKIQYNRVSQLAQELEVLSMADRSAHQGVRGLATATRSVARSKEDMVDIITQADSRSRNVRRNFLALCNNVVSPRDVFSTPRRKQAPPATPSSPRDKAFSRLMPRTQVTVASPVRTVKSSSTAISFKDTPVKSGSKLFALAEDKAALKEAKTFIATPQKKETKPPVTLAPQRPSIPSFGGDNGSNGQEKEASSSSEPPSKRTLGFSNESRKPSGEGSARKMLSFDVPEVSKVSFGDSSFSTPKAKPSVSFSLPDDAKTFSSAEGAKSTGTDYKERLVKFYEVHNPSRVGQAEKTIADFQGKEEDMFKRLFAKYVPGSTGEDVQKFLRGGPVPSKSTKTATASLFSAPSSTGDSTNKPSFSFGKSPSGPTAAASPFGKVSTPTTPLSAASPFGKSSFSLGGGAVSSPKPVLATGGFPAFGAPNAAPPSFGAPTAPNYKQRLIDFYTKHNPSKLSDVDSTLEKYKGNEEKLFQNLAIKYKVNDAGATTTATGFGSTTGFAPKSPGASPFGNAGTFSSISLGSGAQQSAPAFGSTSGLGFGANKPTSTSSPSPFVTAPQESNAFRSVSFGGEQKSAFGALAAVGTSGGGFGAFGSTSAPAFGTTAASAFGAAPGGVNYREKLTQFYQQHNPEKLHTVDSTLEKYKGNEAKLFQMLEQKYLKAGAAPTTGFGGVGGGAPAPAFGGGSAFGAPSALGAASGPPAFGAPSALGGTATPAFGSASGLGGAAAAPAFRARFGASSAPGAAPAGGGFSAFSSQPASFGAFGGGQQGAATGFGGGSAGGFGTGTGGFGSAGGFGGGAHPGGFSSTGSFGMR